MTLLQSSPETIGVLGSLASILALIITGYSRREWLETRWKRLTGRNITEIKSRAKTELVEDIFGESTEVELIDSGTEYGQRIERAAEDATRIRRLSGNLRGQKDQDDYEQFCNPDVDCEVLVIQPEQMDSKIGDYTGNELIRNLKTSRDRDARQGRLVGAYNEIVGHLKPDGDWNSVSVRTYPHTPWIRMAIYEDVHGDKEAGFTFSPSLADFRETQLFWTEDSDLIAALESIFDDIWTDDRTVRVEETLEKLQSEIEG